MKRHPTRGIEAGEKVIYFPGRFFDSIHNGLAKSAWWIYMIILMECIENKSYSMKLKNKELAKKAGLSISTIMRALRNLEKDHYIEKSYSGHIREIKLLDY